MNRKINKFLIVNADDYGLSPVFNKGILELAKMNIISSISVMIKRKNIEIEKLQKFKNISIGLHLELGEKTTHEEIETQISKFKNKFGKFPSHLDGHKHCHLLNKVIDQQNGLNLINFINISVL